MKLLTCILLFSLTLSTINSKSSHEKLLIVSYDGFRFDYLDLYRNVTPVLNQLKASSTHAKCLLNVFPTQTFPNHFSIATGVYSGVHGVLASSVFNQESNSLLHYGYELFHYNEDLIPIWTLNELAGNGRHSGVSMWAGCDFPYLKTNLTFLSTHNSHISFEERVGTAMKWFTDPKTPANLVMMYFEEPDSHSHAFGPYSSQNQDQIQRVDRLTQYILDSLKNNDLTDVNLIFLSDHGMESVTRDNIIDLRPTVGSISNMYGTSPVLQVYPKPGSTVGEVYSNLKKFSQDNGHFSAYLQSEIPEHFYVKDCRRAPPILAVADPPYAFQDLYDGIEWQVENMNASRNGTYGVHGYDPKTVTMHPYFIAHGPAFKVNFNAGELRTVDLYPMFAHVLKLSHRDNLVRVNGSLSRVSHIFKPQPPSSASAQQLIYGNIWTFVFVGNVSVIVVISLALYFRSRRRRRNTERDEEMLETIEAEKLLGESEPI